MSKKKKTNNKDYKLIITIVIIVLVLLFISLIIDKKDSFKVESRINNIKEEQEKDDDIFKTVGWLRVEGTNIDYPIVIDTTGESTEEIDKDSYGWTKIKDEKFYTNMTVIGHNIYNLSKQPKKQSDKFQRFESLLSYTYYDFAKENQYIQYTIDGKDYKYQIFAVNYLSDFDYFIYTNNANISKSENKKSIDGLKKSSIYDYSTEVSKEDKIIYVATCTRMFGTEIKKNFVVSAKLVDNNYNKYEKVKKNKNYDEIEKKLNEGGQEDEEDI